MPSVNEIFNYTPKQWQENQQKIVNRVVSGREQLGLDQERVAEKAGYSLTQYRKLENGERFLELYDFLRIGEVFYKHQESLLPPYKQYLNKLNLWFKGLPYQFRDWLNGLREP